MSFTHEGLLAPGDYPLTFDELRASMLVAGPKGGSPHWDSSWRWFLVERLEILTHQLWQVGIERVYADGSFVEDKDHPNDIDGYFEVPMDRLASGALERELNAQDPQRCWTWRPEDRRSYRGYRKRQLPMWHRYRVELYPHVPGWTSGIFDQHGHELEFPAAFRRSRRNGRPRGIIELRRNTP